MIVVGARDPGQKKSWEQEIWAERSRGSKRSGPKERDRARKLGQKEVEGAREMGPKKSRETEIWAKRTRGSKRAGRKEVV
mgnify:CR=1 FL=1